MRKLFSILLILLSAISYGQTDTALGLRGKKIPLATLNVPSTYLLTPNPTTLIFDSSKVGVALQKNATRDSIRLISGSGSILSTVKDSTGGSTTVDTTLVKVTNNNLGTTRDFTKGLWLRNYTPGALGAMQISPMLLFQGNSFASTPATSIPILIWPDLLPVQGTSTGYGYVRWNYQISGGAITNNVLTIGTAGGNPSVGINAVPFTTSGAALNVGGSAEFSGNLSFSSSTVNFNSFGASWLDMNSMYLRFVPGAYYGVVSDKPHSLGKLTAPTAGAELDIASTGRSFLPPRMTTTQRDAINLTVSSVTVTNGGTGYTSTPTVTYTAGPTPTAVTTAVTTTVTRVGNVITAIPVASPGSYNTPPTITITGGGGTGATATPNMTQVLTAGMTIYNTTTNRTEVWDGTRWISPEITGYRLVTATGNINTDDKIISVNNGGANVTLTLPTPSTTTTNTYTIKRYDATSTGTVTINVTGGGSTIQSFGTLSFGTSVALAAAGNYGQTLTFVSDGTAYQVLQ